NVGQTIVDINNSLKEYASANAIVYVDYHSALADEQLGLPKSMSDDGCHPNADTYYIMEELVLKAIQKAILK
ncbi:MAG: acylhydrolase, partial [Bacteroidales bacterium]|nr:acylhydrolase [Bacteroidales bacterium]